MALADFFFRATPATPTHGPRFSIRRALSVWRSRQALARLDDAALNDIGISSDSAAREAAKPVWDVPATWRD